MAKKPLTTKGRKRNPRVGCKGGDYLMPVSFRTNEWTSELIRNIQRHYKTGYFTQVELSKYYNVSTGLVGKACRIMRENGGEPI